MMHLTYIGISYSYRASDLEGFLVLKDSFIPFYDYGDLLGFTLIKI